MPLVLTQYAQDVSADVNRYLDKEWLIYHFPRKYLRIVEQSIQEYDDRRFLYHRPSRGSTQGQAGYFGYGHISDPYEDIRNAGHYWINILDAHPMGFVSLRNADGIYYESGTDKAPNLQGRSIRYIKPMTYFNILAAGRVYSSAPAALTDPQEAGVFAPVSAPTDSLRDLLEVPVGTGYKPTNNSPVDIYEAAALHERARDDHQRTLMLLTQQVQRLGGHCFYNNNIDLLAIVGERRFLIEAKSLTRQEMAVSRMRYGIGQLLDYGVRYRAEIRDAQPVLAFGSPLARETSWIPNILQENRIAFVTRTGEAIAAGNELGEALPFLTGS